MNERQLADRIAADIFKAGSEPSRGVAGMVQRIAFKGGEYPDTETDLGGYCQRPLADRIHASLIAARDEIFIDKVEEMTKAELSAELRLQGIDPARRPRPSPALSMRPLPKRDLSPERTEGSA